MKKVTSFNLKLLCIGLLVLSGFPSPTVANESTEQNEILDDGNEVIVTEELETDIDSLNEDEVSISEVEEDIPEPETPLESNLEEDSEPIEVQILTDEEEEADHNTSSLADPELVDVIENEDFDFEAYIRESQIRYGTAPFDKNDEPGNDSGQSNGVVRTFDSISYPITITINPKKVDVLENIVVKISGTLENGVQEERINARFAVGGYENYEDSVVGFEQEYTIPRTGNSVMIPISVEVQGAEPNIMLTPDFKVQIMSIDGEDYTQNDEYIEFTDLPSARVSGKVNIKPNVRAGLAGQGMPYLPYAAVNENTDDISNLMPFSVAFNLERLSGKNDIRGATFPTGKINYSIDLDGYVYWDGGDKQGKNVPLNFDEQDSPLFLFDHQPINQIYSKVGSENTLAEGEEYTFTFAHRYSAARSNLPDFSLESIDEESYRSVWESGKWSIGKPRVTSSKVNYQGVNEEFVIGSTFPQYRSDGWSGSPLYGVNDRIFSTHSFIMKVPNEYTIGGKNNPEGIANNVFYKATATIISYEDHDGNVKEINNDHSVTFQERNNPSGGFSVNNTFQSYPAGSPIGTYRIGDSTVSHGDPSTVIGSDVRYRSYVLSRLTSYGGMDIVYRWNSDSFELTKDYAAIAKRNILSGGYHNGQAERVTNDYDNHTVFFGVAKEEDNSFEVFTSRGKDDYHWYEDYEEASKKGRVGAIKSEIKATVGARVNASVHFPLHVKTNRIGSLNDQDTPNIIVTNAYAFLDSERKRMVDISATRSYNNPSLYDEEGGLVKLQSPVGSAINFETLAIQNAITESRISSERMTYYNSDEVNWTVESNMVLPFTGVPDKFNGAVEIKQILPAGLDYKIGSGKVGNTNREPRIENRADGSSVLRWNLTVSERDVQINDIRFTTTINPLALGSGVQSSLKVDNIITSNLDTREEHLRTTSRTLNILKVGMVGIQQSIDKMYGEIDSDYTLTIQPYTTIEDEKDVKGITILPINGDNLGSKFNGSATLDSIDIRGDKEVQIFLNDKVVDQRFPQNIDLTTDGWYRYEGGNQDLTKVSSVLFFIEGILTNRDKVEIDYKIQTRDNEFGNVYFNESTINSATNYNLSPISNRVNYTIRADVEIGLERIRIYTDKHDVGLPVRVRLNKDVIDEDVLEEEVTLAIYREEDEAKVFEERYDIAALETDNEMLIPEEFLEVNSMSVYEVRIEEFDKRKIFVPADRSKIKTEGYTSSELDIVVDASETNKFEYEGVIMTEREFDKEMVKYFEKVTIPTNKLPSIKSGYGLPINYEVSYKNDLRQFYDLEASLLVDTKLIDSFLDYEIEGDNSIISMEIESEGVQETLSKKEFTLPEVFVEKETGYVFSKDQVDQGDERITNELSQGGNKLYIPIWVEDIKEYATEFSSTNPVGVNQIMFNITDFIDVYAYMYGHIGSDTIDQDEILIEPVNLHNPFRQGLPEGWSEEDINWITNGN